MIIRDAKLKDAGVICAIWNPVIRDTLITFNPVLKTQKSVTQMLKDKAAAKDPFLLACAQEEVLGFATYGQFRSGDGYRHTVEHTIILAPSARGRGVGGRTDASYRRSRTRRRQTFYVGGRVWRKPRSGAFPYRRWILCGLAFAAGWV